MAFTGDALFERIEEEWSMNVGGSKDDWEGFRTGGN